MTVITSLYPSETHQPITLQRLNLKQLTKCEIIPIINLSVSKERDTLNASCLFSLNEVNFLIKKQNTKTCFLEEFISLFCQLKKERKKEEVISPRKR